ncbi:MAG: V-type ATP synthase subunit F [Clostridiales bacterium]|nr:V-type ATP synthase subunit F [Clostridiales bacterium]
MKYFLITDNVDTRTGMRLAGVESELASTRRETVEAIDRVVADETVGVLLITEKLARLCPDVLDDLKLNLETPLVVEIPDRHGTGRLPDSITRYIREAIGVKL